MSEEGISLGEAQPRSSPQPNLRPKSTLLTKPKPVKKSVASHFAYSVTFIGVAGTRQLPRILTRQPHLPGEGASSGENISMMVDELGFRLLPSRYSIGYADSLAFVRDDMAVFDLRPANVVGTPNGVLAPFDAIPARLDAKTRAILAVAETSQMRNCGETAHQM